MVGRKAEGRRQKREVQSAEGRVQRGEVVDFVFRAPRYPVIVVAGERVFRAAAKRDLDRLVRREVIDLVDRRSNRSAEEPARRRSLSSRTREEIFLELMEGLPRS